MKIPSSITEYLTECEIRKYTPRTLRSYKNNLSLFCNFCLSIGVEDTTDLAITQTYLRSLSNDSILEIARGHSVLQNL